MKPYDTCLICGRFQTFHIGHESLVETGLKLCDRVLILVGSAQECGTPKRCILSHYPISFYNGHYYGAIMLYGHVHITEEYQHIQKIEKWLNENNCPVQMYNVGCMLWDYETVTLDEILAKHN